MKTARTFTQLLASFCMVLAITACGGGGGDSTDTNTTSPASQLVHRDNVNDAKGAYDRITDGMSLEQVKVFLGGPDYTNKGTLPDGTTLDVYQWAFADGTILQLTYRNGRLQWKILGNMNQTLVNHQYF